MQMSIYSILLKILIILFSIVMKSAFLILLTLIIIFDEYDTLTINLIRLLTWYRKLEKCDALIKI